MLIMATATQAFKMNGLYLKVQLLIKYFTTFDVLSNSLGLLMYEYKATLSKRYFKKVISPGVGT